jgi:hypothetical protein
MRGISSSIADTGQASSSLGVSTVIGTSVSLVSIDASSLLSASCNCSFEGKKEKKKIILHE